MAGKNGAVLDRVEHPMNHPPFSDFVGKTNAKVCFHNNIHTVCVARPEADKHLNVEALVRDPQLRSPTNPEGTVDLLKADEQRVYLAFHHPEAPKLLDPHYR